MTTKYNQSLRLTLGVVVLAIAFSSTHEAKASGWTTNGPLLTGRYHHTATLLPNGQVLVAGGSTLSTAFSSAELYDPATGTWKSTSPMNSVRRDATATMLPNGKVLVAGGYLGVGVVTNGAEL
jgi:Flp pilus assembly secretin CpaC